MAGTGRGAEGAGAGAAAPATAAGAEPAVTPRPASTVMVVRDGAHATAPLEVLMLRRSLRADFVGGAHVFPGGAVDPGDRDPTWGARCPGLPDAAASATLGLDEGGLAYWVAAVRECFEESGLLLARDASGDAISFSEHDVGDRFGRHRTALNARERSFLDVCEAEGLSLLVESLHYFAHWITPEGSPRRYDTRFFVAPAPAGQEPAHDAGETISDVWVRPADALDHHRSGDMELILPTIKNLQAIGRFATTAELLDAASAARDVPAVLPRVVADTGGVRLLLPGDAGYDVPGSGSEEAARRLSSDFDAATRLASRAANPAGGTEGAGDGRRRGGRGRGAGHG